MARTRFAKAVVYEDAAGQWRWRLVAGNGRIICTPGESFTRRCDAYRSLVLVQAMMSRLRKVEG